MRRAFLAWSVLFLLCGGGLLLAWPSDRITPEGYRQVQLGMTRADVEGILGETDASRDDATVEFILHCVASSSHGDRDDLSEGDSSKGGDMRLWHGDTGIIWISMDANGLVAWKCFHPIARPSAFARLRQWLGA